MEKLPLKRPRKKPEQINIEKKLEIIKFSDENRLLSHEKIGEIFNIDRSTIPGILRKKEAILSISNSNDSIQKKRLRDGLFPYLDDSVFKWFLFARSKSFPVTQEILSAKALEFKKEFLTKLQDHDELERLSKS